MCFGKRSVLFVETANERVRLQLPGLGCGANYEKPRWDWKLRSKSEDRLRFGWVSNLLFMPGMGAVTPGGQGRGTRGEFLKRGQDNQNIVKAVNLEKEERFVEAERIYREVLVRHPEGRIKHRGFSTGSCRASRLPAAIEFAVACRLDGS